MPAWAITLLVRFVLPLLIQLAVRNNLIGELTGALAKFGLSLKSDHEPKDFPSAPPATMTPNNLQAQKVQ